MVIDHIGIVVKSINTAIVKWKLVFGYHQMTKKTTNIKQKVNVVFLEKKGTVDIKLIEPLDDLSPVFKFAKRGGGLHHICFKCNDLKLKIKELQDKGCRLIAKPQPGEAFGNENIAFLYTGSGLNIELIDTDKRANRI